MNNKNKTTGGQLVSVEMTEDEASRFIAYQQYHDIFNVLLDNGVFDTKNGSVVLHFNFQGQLMKIDRNQILFLLKTNLNAG